MTGLHARLRAHAAADPSRVALTFAPAHRDFERIDLTRGELAASADAMAARLLERLAPGDRALLMLPASPEFAVSFLGCLAAGVIAVPVPPPVTEPARRRVLSVAHDCTPAAVVSLSFVQDLVADGRPELRELYDSFEWLLVDPLDAGVAGAAPSAPAVTADAIALLQYTSGSTRTPRGAMLSHRSLLSNEAAIREAFGVTADSTIVSWLPVHHDMGLIGGLLQPLYAGARGVVLDPVSFMRSPVDWLRTISEVGADISGAPNFAYDLCARTVGPAEKASIDLSSWRVAFNGAGPVFPRTLRAFSDAFRDAGFRPSAHVPSYGLAEATLFVARGGTAGSVTSRRFSAESLERGTAREAQPGESGARELVAYALPSHAAVRVVDPVTLEPLSEGSVGELTVAGEGNASGYWGHPSGSEAVFGAVVPAEPAPVVRTGDLGFVHGGDFYVVGRIKDLVVHRGRNLSPDDLEADISSCDGDLKSTCAVFGVDRDGDEAVVVCQEVRATTRPERYPELADRIRAALSNAHGVAAETILLVPPGTVDRTSSGKIRRHAVRARFLADRLDPLHVSTLARAEPHIPALAERIGDGLAGLDHPARVEHVTRALCDHLQGVLGLPERPSRDDALASLGVDSLLAVRLQYEVEAALGVALRPALMLRAESIAELAETASRARAARRQGTRPPARETDGYELTAAQRALWFLQRAFPRSFGYNVTRGFRLTGEIDVEAVADALAAVAARHPSLRLSVLVEDGQPRPVVRQEPDVELEVVDARSWTEGQRSEWQRGFATRVFDLEHDRLVRAALVRRAGDFLLVLSLHHIVCDVVSLAVVVSELAEAYAAATVPPPHGGPRVSPADRERAVLAERGQELAAYWEKELAGELPTLSLPPLGSVPAGREWRGAGASVPCEVTVELTAKLTRLARASGLTLHNVLLGAYQVLLHRLTGQPDVLVGVPTLGRDDRALASWVGYLVNVVPIRSSYAGGTAFTGFARATQDRVLGAMDHQDLPLSHITRLVEPDRDSAAALIFQAMFAYYAPALPAGAAAAAAVFGDPDASLSLGTATLRGEWTPDHTAQADVCMNAIVGDEAIRLELQYDVDAVSREQAELTARSFTTLLAAIVDAPETAVRRLPLLTDAEARSLVESSVGPRIPRTAHYLDAFEQVAARQPDAEAAADGEVRVGYGELDERSNHVAARLRAEGVGVDGNVVVCASRSTDYLVALLGIHKADGCYVPISPAEAPRRAAAMIAALEPAACVADATGRRLLARARAGLDGGRAPAVLDLHELSAGRAAQPPPRASPELGASYIIHTSGSTGTPKRAVSTNVGLTNHLWQMIEYFGLDHDDCVAQTGPVSFDVSVWQLLTPLLVGGRVRVVPEPASLSPAALLKATLEDDVTLLELVPSVVAALLDAGLAASPGALRIMIATGEALGADLPRRWRDELPGIPLYNAYGPAECTDDVSIGLSAFGPERRTTVSIGRPLTNTSMLLLDDEMAPVPDGVAGRLCVGGLGVGRGYHGDPRRTAAAFLPDPWSDTPGARLYHTGDMARATGDGEVEFLGRADKQIKVRGVRIEPGEIEAALRECPDVVDAAVKLHEGTAGAVLVGYVVLGAEEREAVAGDGIRVLAPAEDAPLRAMLAERLPRAMMPTVLARLPRLPRSPNGKVDYRALDHVEEPAPVDQDQDGRFDDPLAATVRSIWADLLERDVAWSDSFFHLGGHSLLALTMIDRIGRTLEVELDVDSVFTHPRLGDFVDAVRRSDRAGRGGHRGRARPAAHVDVPASSAQQRFWFLHEADPGRPTYNMPGVLRMRGALDEDALEGALRDALGRHPVLRARFSDDDGLTWTAAADRFDLPRLDLRGALAELGDEAFDRFVHGEANTAPDLRREVPFRAVLVRVGPEAWRLVVTIDHIACDAWSLSVFLDDLAESYNARAGHAAQPPATAAYTFADYCFDEREWLMERDREADLAPWRGVADGPCSLSPLTPCAEPAGGPGGPGGGRHSIWIGEELADAIRAFAGETGTTPFIVFATAVSALTHRGGSERETVLLGTLIAQRDRPELQRIVGPLLNVSVLATPLSLADSATAAVLRTRDSALRAYRSRHVPFEDIARLLPAAPDGDGSPFEVMLLMQPPSGEPELHGLTTELVGVDPDTAPYPLTIDIEAVGADWRVSFRHATDRYDHADVEALALRLHELIALLVRDSDAALGALLRSLEPAGARGS